MEVYMIQMGEIYEYIQMENETKLKPKLFHYRIRKKKVCMMSIVLEQEIVQHKKIGCNGQLYMNQDGKVHRVTGNKIYENGIMTRKYLHLYCVKIEEMRE